MKRPSTTYLILHNIRSAHNVGAIFRTADAVGVSKIFLTGYTPAPLDRFGRPRKDIAKAALGAELTIPWESLSSIKRVLTRLQKKKVYVVAVEQDAAAIPYTRIRPRHSIAFIFGNEVTGLPKEVLRSAEVIAEIPMRGVKESLNVSVAAGVVLFNTSLHR